MNFYQSDLRRVINTQIYKKPSFETSIAWKKYFGIVKTQRRFGKTLNRYMVHGIDVDVNENNSEFLESVKHVRRDFGSSRGDIFFQFWILDEKQTLETSSLKEDEKLVKKILEEKEKKNAQMRETFELVPSRREHMPDTTVVLDISKWIQETRRWYSKSWKRYINKAKKQELSFEIADKRQRGVFWDIWYTMAYDKWFAIISKEVFITLMEYLTQEKKWRLFLSKKWTKIVSGSVVLENHEPKKAWDNKKQLIYLYWATNREFGNIWGHYRLTDQIMKRWADHHYESYDLLWVAPPGNEKHYLSGVTRFKQAFGGTTILSSWNYDLVTNSMLYRTMQVLKK